MKLKIIFVLASVFALTQALSEDELLQIKKNRDECIASTGIDVEDLKKLEAGEFNEDPKSREYIYCCFRKSGFINEDNKIDHDKINEMVTSKFGKDVAEKLHKLCSDKIGSTGLETANLMGKCYHENTPKLKVLSDELIEKINKTRQECIASSGIDVVVVTKLLEGQFIDDPKIKDYMYCCFIKGKFISEDNKVDNTNIKEMLLLKFGKDTADNLFKLCSEKIGSTAIETAYVMGKCFLENKPEHKV